MSECPLPKAPKVVFISVVLISFRELRDDVTFFLLFLLLLTLHYLFFLVYSLMMIFAVFIPFSSFFAKLYLKKQNKQTIKME